MDLNPPSPPQNPPPPKAKIRGWKRPSEKPMDRKSDSYPPVSTGSWGHLLPEA